jgi:hypothetical protein
MTNYWLKITSEGKAGNSQPCVIVRRNGEVKIIRPVRIIVEGTCLGGWTILVPQVAKCAIKYY